MSCVPEKPWQWGLIFAYLMLEYWLGKTAKTRAGSVPELVLMGFVALLLTLILWRKNGKTRNQGN